MSKQFQWRTSFNLISGGYPGEWTGVNPPDTSWHTTDATSGSVTAEYYYRDSRISSNENSSQVVVTIKDDWTASINSRNQLTLTITSTVTNIRRDDFRGDNAGNPNRNIYIRRYNGGPVIWNVSDPATYPHDLGNNIALGTYMLTLEPGQGATGSSIYYRSVTVGHDNDPVPNAYCDEIAMGIEFKNILPADYRPGATRDSGGVWQSHNREGGAVHILTGNGVWREQRTLGGGVDCGNPPSIRKEDKWFNQRLIGKE